MTNGSAVNHLPTTEVAVVGGGVIGLSCAFELARRGKSVTVIEREETGFGASTVAAGMLAPVLRD